MAGAATPPAGVIEATVKDEAGKPVDDAVVYLVAAGTSGRPQAAVTMDQIDKEFVPATLPVEVGTPVVFPNRDNIKHHVYSFSPAKKFELPLYIGTPANPVVFDKVGIVALGCNIHDWMVGYVYVVPTPYFAKTGPDGKARIADAPAGAYDAHAWHPRLKGSPEPSVQRLTLSPAGTEQAAFAMSLKRDWRPPRRGYEQQQGN